MPNFEVGLLPVSNVVGTVVFMKSGASNHAHETC